jgi:peroxiredoxin
MHRSALFAASLALAACLTGQQVTPGKTHLKVGDEAPNFTLPDSAGKPVNLSDFRGKQTVVLAFFPAAFTGG